MPLARWLIVACLVLRAASFATLQAPQVTSLPAPYQVAGIERLVPDRDVGEGVPRLGELRVVVDLDDADRLPPPDRDDSTRATIIGTDGHAEAHLVDIERRCEFLCGDEMASCRHVAVYAGAGLGGLGTPLLALPGSWTLREHRSVVGEDSRGVTAPPQDVTPMAEAPVSDALAPSLNPDAEFGRPIWSLRSDDPRRYRLVRDSTEPSALALEVLAGDGDIYTYPTRGCVYRRVFDLGSLDCQGISLLLDEGRPLLVSFPDYNVDVADVVASFVHDEVDYLVIRLGLKAQTVFGLLRPADDGWVPLIRPRDFDLLC